MESKGMNKKREWIKKEILKIIKNKKGKIQLKKEQIRRILKMQWKKR